MCMNSLRKGECFFESCRFNHVKGTKRHPPVIKNRNSGHIENGERVETMPEKIDQSTEIQNDTSPKSFTNPVQPSNDPGHFLEVVRLLKQEIITTINQKITAIQKQVQQLQQVYPIHAMQQQQMGNTTLISLKRISIQHQVTNTFNPNTNTN